MQSHTSLFGELVSQNIVALLSTNIFTRNRSTNHCEQHLEALFGVQRMRVIGWHNKHFSSTNFVRLAIDKDLSNAILAQGKRSIYPQANHTRICTIASYGDVCSVRPCPTSNAKRVKDPVAFWKMIFDTVLPCVYSIVAAKGTWRPMNSGIGGYFGAAICTEIWILARFPDRLCFSHFSMGWISSDFSWTSAGFGALGGLFIGIAVACLLLFNGKLAGISGIISGVLIPNKVKGGDGNMHIGT